MHVLTYYYIRGNISQVNFCGLATIYEIFSVVTWDAQFLRNVTFLKRFPCNKFVILQRSIVDEINRESETDIITIIISYLLMFVYITIFLGHIRSIKTICVSRRDSCVCVCVCVYT